ncbi:MAG: glycoside hydrolase family 28 protein [Candidatus Cyclobacteriaceae bacterium M3_2C_046]
MKYILINKLLILSLIASAKDYNIIDFGARENALSTEAIQNAVDACHQAGGGKVVVPAGSYITGTIILKSQVNLHLQAGATLLGSHNLDDYTLTFRGHGIIFCEDAYQVSITGEGTIDARGTHFFDPTANHVYPEFDKSRVRQKERYMPEGEFYSDGPIKKGPKPGMTVAFFHCSQIAIQDITIKDTPSWAVRLAYCDDALVQGISIVNNLMVPNSDGVHCTASRNIRMTDCDIRAGDDAFIITGFTKDEETPGYDLTEQQKYTYGNKTAYAENINLSNCQLQSRSSGIRVGYGQHPIRRCTFSNIIIYGSNRGIGIFAHDETDIEELIFSNIIIETRLHSGQWWGNGEPIHLSSISRFPDQPVGVIKNVQFHNVIATSEHGIILYGHEQSPMENISFENIQLKIKKGKETMAYGGNFDLRPAADISMQLFAHDIPGLYARYVNGLDIEDFSLEWEPDLPEFFTHGIEAEYVKELKLEGFEGGPNPSAATGKKIQLNNTDFPGQIK